MERLARAALGKFRGTCGKHILHLLRPEYGSRELLDKVLLDFLGLCVGQSIHVLIDGTLGRVEGRLGDGLLKLLLCGEHQRAVEGTAHGEHECALGTSLLQTGAGHIDSFNFARDNELAGAVVVGTNNDTRFL